MPPKTILLALSLALGTTGATAQTEITEPLQMQHIRNATTKVTYAGRTFLVDPMLAAKDAYSGFESTFHSERRNPMVDLPMQAEKVMEGVDAVIVTHTHLDHWDGGEHQFIRKDVPLFVQHEADATLIRGQGYTDVRVLGEGTTFEGVTLTKTGGQHGTDEMYAVPPLAETLAEAMGVVFQAADAPTVYFVGDTIWRPEVDAALENFAPDVVVLNTGEARLPGFTGSIIMSKDDVLHATQAVPDATVVTVHMDAINHMNLSREQLRDFIEQNGIEDKVRIPADGEVVKF